MGICAIVLERQISPLRGVNRYCYAYIDRVATETHAKTIGALIRRRRVELGLTQTGLSALLGVSVWSIHQWESGRARPRQFRKQIADWLGAGTDSFFNPHAGQ